MDPFSIVVSVTSLAALGVSVSKQVYSFVKEVEDAPRAILEVSAALSNLNSIFEQLKGTLENDFDSRPPYSRAAARDLRAVLDDCTKVLKRLETLMDKFTIYAKGAAFKQILGGIRFTFKESELVNIQRTLEAHKSTLTITLMVTLISTATRIDTNVAENKALTLKLIRQKTMELNVSSDVADDSRDTMKAYLQNTKVSMIEGVPQAVQEEECIEEAQDKQLDKVKDDPQDGAHDESHNERYVEKCEKPQEEPQEKPRRKPSEEQGDKQHEEISQKTPQGPSTTVPIDPSLVSPADAPRKPAVSDNSSSDDFAIGLMSAAFAGDLQMVLLLLDFASDIDYIDPSFAGLGSALQAAALAGRLPIVQALLARKANPNAGGGRWENPLKSAVGAGPGYPQIVLELLKAGANPNTPGILRSAAWEGNSTSVGYLLDYGADINEVDKMDGTALQMAALAGREEVVTMLLERRANPNLGAGRFENPLTAAVHGTSKPGIVLRLLKAGADKNTHGILHYAAECKNATAIGHLLDAGSDINALNNSSETPLLVAARYGYEDVVKLLLDRGADYRIGKSALGAAIASGHRNIARELVVRGAGPAKSS